jgi:hypothetical protein
MAKLYDHITGDLAAFIRAQPLFFVASAPLDAQGHINLSPKGLDSFRILSPQQVAYLDITGSGNETSAHLAENGRITFMFCAFVHSPRILRLYGEGRVILPSSTKWEMLAPQFQHYPGMRQIIVANITRVQTSCGFGIPLMDYVAQRDAAIRWAEMKGEEGILAYQCEKNVTSIDGLRTPLAEQLEQGAR